MRGVFVLDNNNETQKLTINSCATYIQARRKKWKYRLVYENRYYSEYRILNKQPKEGKIQFYFYLISDRERRA